MMSNLKRVAGLMLIKQYNEAQNIKRNISEFPLLLENTSYVHKMLSRFPVEHFATWMLSRMEG